VVALATPVVLDAQSNYVLNMSIHADETPAVVTQRLAPELMRLRKQLIDLHSHTLG
jgi:hypothetical protein